MEFTRSQTAFDGESWSLKLNRRDSSPPEHIELRAGGEKALLRDADWVAQLAQAEQLSLADAGRRAASRQPVSEDIARLPSPGAPDDDRKAMVVRTKTDGRPYLSDTAIVKGKTPAELETTVREVAREAKAQPKKSLGQIVADVRRALEQFSSQARSLLD